MRRFLLFVFASGLTLAGCAPIVDTSSSFSYAFPTPQDQAAREMVEQYKKDQAAFSSPTLFEIPNPLPTWACKVEETEQYRLAQVPLKLDMAQADKLVSKISRNMGAAPPPKTTFSNIKIIPIKTQCKQGKLDGEIQLQSNYDSTSEGSNNMMLSGKVVKQTYIIRAHFSKMAYLSMKEGKPLGKTTIVEESSSSNESHSDDAKMEEMMQKNNEQFKKNGGQTSNKTRSVTYVTSKDGMFGTFIESAYQDITANLLSGVQVKQRPTLSVSFTHPDGRYKRMESYTNGQLSSIMNFKDGKMHGEHVTYMENVFKKNGQKLDQMPGYEDAKEVVLNGFDFIQKTTCYKDGAVIKTATCSNK